MNRLNEELNVVVLRKILRIGSVQSRLAAAFFVACALISCASFQSATNAENKQTGITYFLPEKAVQVSMTVPTDGTAPTVQVVATASYADTASRYVLKLARSPVAKTTVDIGVSPNGLLTTATSDTSSQLSDIFKALAADAGSLHAFAAPRAPPAAPAAPTPVCTPGSFSAIRTIAELTKTGSVDIFQSEAADCQVKVKVRNAFASDGKMPANTPEPTSKYGVYYRQAQTYLVTVDVSPTVAPARHWSFPSLISSPSGSPTLFAPISRTLFANNKAEFTFSDGILTEVKQNPDGEVLGLVKLPADIISAYFAAIGTVFTGRKDALADEKSYVDAQATLEQSRQKTARCIAALQTGDQATSTAACGN